MPDGTRPSRYDILFEPVRIGPKVAKNRFFQVPHCNGGGYRDPSAVAEMRRTKAEGGWGVIMTEQTEIHPSSEITPFIEQHLWEDKDIPAMAAMAEAMKSHGALAGIQLAYSGINGPNLYSREVPLAVTGGPILTFTPDPVQARTLDREDIADLRRWFRAAFRRSRQAGFDIICLYGAHGFGIFQHFLSRATNRRDDEYGGSLENRARFLREVVEEAREETKGELAVSLRLSLHEGGPLGFSNAELRDFIAMHADLPDLWDLAQGTWEACSGTSRFVAEGAALDRRSVPAQKDRGGADRGHPRMHRLQHLRVGRHDGCDQPLHAEHRLHGGMAQGLASRTGAAEGPVGERAGGRRGSGGARGRAAGGAAGIPGDAGRG
jgi:dimethylamine/trimethylamine dehydrogenase